MTQGFLIRFICIVLESPHFPFNLLGSSVKARVANIGAWSSDRMTADTEISSPGRKNKFNY